MRVQASVQALAEELQAAHSERHGSSHSVWPRVDAAVNDLLAQNSSGQLNGVFYGRLHSLATVPAPADALAVNAVLSELCNLVSLLALVILHSVNCCKQSQSTLL